MPESSKYQTRAYAEVYDEDKFGASFGRYLQDREVETFLSLMVASDKKVLDVGAGTGKLSIPLILDSRQVVSADLSPEMLRIAGRNANHANVALRAIVTDAHHLCFDSGSFDCVVSSRMLMHLSDWRRGLSELCRVSNGGVIIEFPPLLSSNGLDSVLKRIRHLFSRGPHPYKVYLVGSVTKELEKRNFRVVTLRRGFFLPTAFHRKLNHPGLSSGIEKVCRMLGLVSLLGAPVTVMARKTGAAEQKATGVVREVVGGEPEEVPTA